MQKNQLIITLVVFVALVSGILWFVFSERPKTDAKLQTPPPTSTPKPEVIKTEAEGARIVTPGATPAKDEYRECLDKFMESQVKGEYGNWCEEKDATRMFAVRGWTIVGESNLRVDGTAYVVRVDSSNKGGQQITKLWNIWVEKKNGQTCISYLSAKD